ncbi:hypothetical protein ACFU93_21365 [Streptomyces sp. NPDC057611]|uniref:hypothetical protein n=1 Tax=Streptomyces sp. NPDC057611 TaxID=3346182 RepID=UPI0036B03990
MASADEFVRRMEELQAAKGEAFKPLAEVLAQRDDLKKELETLVADFEARIAALDEPYGRAYAGAEKAGWNATELAALGADEPVKRPRGRRPGKSTTAKRAASKQAAAAPETSAPETSTPAVPAPAQEGTADVVAAAGFPSS